MKTVKIIVGIITFLVVMFLSTGLFVKETTYEASINVNEPLQKVFEHFSDVKNIKNWIPEVKSVTALHENPDKIGNRYQIVLENNGQELTITEHIKDYVENEKITLFFDAENMLKKDVYTFTENAGVTTIHLSSNCRSDSYIMACMFPYFKGTFKAQDQGYLNNFKAYAEK